MSAPTDSDRRKARDAALRTQDEAIAEHLAQAMKSGELQSAESFGKPMEDDGWFQTPSEFRLSFKILKNAGGTAPEVELFHRRATLRAQLAAAESDADRAALQARLSALEQLIALRLEALRISGTL